MLWAFLLALAAAAYPQEISRRVAVLEFEPVGVPAELAVDAQHSVERALYGVRELVLIERQQIDVLLREQQLQLSDLADQDTAVQVGRILAASTVVTGTVYDPRSPRVSVKALDVQTGAVLFVGEIPLTGGRASGAARGLARGIERALFPERFKPAVWEVGGGAFGGAPVAQMGRLIDPGGGGFGCAEVENAGLNNLVLGARAGFSWLPGSDANTQRLLHLPVVGTAGYRWSLRGDLFLQPTLAAGLALNILSWDQDGYVEGVEQPQYSAEAGVAPLLAVGLAVGYGRSQWIVKGGSELEVLLESGGSKLLVTFSAGVSRRFPEGDTESR